MRVGEWVYTVVAAAVLVAMVAFGASRAYAVDESPAAALAEAGEASAGEAAVDYSAQLQRIEDLLSERDLAPVTERLDALLDGADVETGSQYKEDVRTLLAGVASVDSFTLLACLLEVGVMLALVFVVAVRR